MNYEKDGLKKLKRLPQIDLQSHGNKPFSIFSNQKEKRTKLSRETQKMLSYLDNQ